LSTVAPIDAGSSIPVAASQAPPARSEGRPRWWLEALTIGWLCWIYDAITNLAPLRMHAALGDAHKVLSLEQSLGIDPEHALDRWLAVHPSLALAISDYYDNAHFIVTLGLLGWLWWQRADIYRPLRNVLVLVNVLAFAVFWLFPVAPPRLLPGFVDVVATTGAIGSWHTGALASAANQYAAMPSLHIAWAVWCTLVVWCVWRRPSVRALAVVYPFVTAFAVLATGNHYVLDLLGGLLTIGAAYAIVSLLERRRGRPGIGRSRRTAAVTSARPGAYRLSQSCYEVQDQVH
jgi:hypothetical protein